MLLVDQQLIQLVRNGQVPGQTPDNSQCAILNSSESCVTNIGYDLRADYFIRDAAHMEEFVLHPGESVFVATQEQIWLDETTIGRLTLKNSRIRMGLSLDAPVYQPGHRTVVFFRLTNISDADIKLMHGEKYAMLMLEQLETAPAHPYDGAFQNEFDYKDLAAYETAYGKQIEAIEHKIDRLKELERSVYGNVITILTIFVAIFTILNVNISLASSAQATAITFLTYNLTTLGATGFLAALMNEILNQKSEKRRGLWLVPIAAFIAVAILYFLQRL